ncbi:MAG: DUF3592 domain-containing protein [Actinomycetota bacterium]
MEGDGRRRTLRLLYGIVLGLVAVGGLVTIVDWARRGHELPGGGVPVTGRVVEEQPGFSGALAIVEVAYDAGGKERRARLPVPGSDQHPNEPTYRPGDAIPLLVSRTDPERVHHANWDSGTARAPIPGWLLALAAVGIITPLVLRGPRRRLQEAITGALKGGGGRGI